MTPYVTPIVGKYPEKGVGVRDHRVMVLDTPMNQIMGGTRPKIERSEVRQITGKITLIQKRYINTFKKLLEYRGYYGGIKQLFGKTLNGPIK